METVRTPTERFMELPDVPWKPHYIDDLAGYERLRMHYVDEGPDEGDVYLCCTENQLGLTFTAR